MVLVWYLYDIYTSTLVESWLSYGQALIKLQTIPRPSPDQRCTIEVTEMIKLYCFCNFTKTDLHFNIDETKLL